MNLIPINQDIVNSIYDIPLGSSDWADVVEMLKKEFNAHFGFMIIIKPSHKPITLSLNFKNNKLWQIYADDCYKQYSRGNKYATDEVFFEYLQLDNSYWKPNKYYHTVGGILSTRNNTLIVLGFPRDKISGVYVDSETQQMAFYARQIIRAIELDGMLGNSLPKKIYEDALKSSYCLTNAESRLVLELYKRGSLPKASRSLNRSYHTVRNQIKSIFKKTKTSNQVELFKLLATKYY